MKRIKTAILIILCLIACYSYAWSNANTADTLMIKAGDCKTLDLGIDGIDGIDALM